MAPTWISQVTVTASLTAFLYEGFAYNVVYLGRVLPASGKSELIAPSLFIFNTFLGLALWSYLRTSWADPGIAPREWHDFASRAGPMLQVAPVRKDWQAGKVTMCRFCAKPRPERAHHCTVCGVCVMRLDHHCPWINNCVGFYNRKFFIQLLGYVYASLLVVVFGTLPELWRRGCCLFFTPQGADTWFIVSFMLVLVMFLLSLLLLGTLTQFIKFHVKLVLDNYTTIENLEREEDAKSKFDIGRRRNLEQVFGENRWLWGLPLHTQASRPVGDGVRWRVHYTRVVDEDEEVPAD
mmetsp:Transcript_117471/g.328871  ORF Transcript_117471/g.328871 Transcript_117471/m.328871 type:complete len:294 (+) Transcript_117471:72-953(+)